MREGSLSFVPWRDWVVLTDDWLSLLLTDEEEMALSTLLMETLVGSLLVPLLGLLEDDILSVVVLYALVNRGLVSMYVDTCVDAHFGDSSQ